MVLGVEGLLVLVQIDLSGADLALFEAYEDQVLPLLARHGGRLEERVRSVSGDREMHLVHFPDGDALEAFRSDPARLAAQPLWTRCGATSTLVEVSRIP